MPGMKNKIFEDDPMLNINEMARITGLAPMTLYHWAEQNRLPWDSHQVAPTKRVSRQSVVLAWLEAVRVPAAKPVLKSKEEVMPII